MVGFKVGLSLKKGGLSAPTKPSSGKQKPIFGDDSSEEDEAKPVSTSRDDSTTIATFGDDPTTTKIPTKPTFAPKPKPNLNLPKPNTNLSALKSSREIADAATALDPSVYDYDAAYDSLHAATTAKRTAARAEAAERKPKYMENLMKSAEIRKQDQLRAKDKQLAREREAEGDEFADKDRFVTDAYKAQQEEVRKAEEEEKKREEAEAKKRVGKGMAGFYRSIMDDQDQQHREVVAAAAKASAEKHATNENDKDSADSAAANNDDTERAATNLARDLNAKGANVVLNDEGLVADKRQLLSAGLNIAPKPKPSSSSTSNSASASTQPNASTSQYRPLNPHDRKDAQRAQRERQTRMVEAQLEQATKRAADEEAEELARREQALKSKKTSTDVEGARERFLRRKKEAEEAKRKANEG